MAVVFVMITVMAVPAASFAAADITVEVNGTQLTMDQPPIIQNSRTLVPLRVIFEALGASVDWDSVTKTVFADWGNNSLTLQIGEKSMKLGDGTTVALDVPATIINSRTLVPLRAVSEAMGASVDWDGTARKVTVNYTYHVDESLLVTNEAQFVYKDKDSYHIFFLEGEKVTGYTVYTKCANDKTAQTYADSLSESEVTEKCVVDEWVVADYPEKTYKDLTLAELEKKHTAYKG